MPPKVRIELDRAHVLSVGVSLAAPYVFKVTRQVLNRSVVLTPVNTGNLKNSQTMTMRARRTFVAGTVETRVKYAEWVMRGTPPHTIRARRKKALAFNWKAQGNVRVVVPKSGKGPTGLRKGKRGVVLYIGKGYVKHPGTKARPFMYRALREVAGAEGFTISFIGGLGAPLAG